MSDEPASEMDEAFDALVGELVTPMAVVTTASPGGGEPRAGCLVGFHGQCGLEPRRYAVWLSKANRTYRVGVLADTFAVHLLGRDDGEVAALFGTETGDEVDKLARGAWTEGPGGVPLLDACPNRLVGRRVALLDAGADHVCVVLAPVRVDHAGLGPQLSLPDVAGLEPGHGAGERQRPH